MLSAKNRIGDKIIVGVNAFTGGQETALPSSG